jgi:hypothetical protein
MDSVHGPRTTAHGLVHDGLKRWHGQGSPDRGNVVAMARRSSSAIAGEDEKRMVASF